VNLRAVVVPSLTVVCLSLSGVGVAAASGTVPEVEVSATAAVEPTGEPSPPADDTETETPAETAPPATTTPAPTGPVFVDRDCADFPTQAAAQDALFEDVTDPHGLDANNNGVACEAHFGLDATADTHSGSGVLVSDPDVPVGAVATGAA
jgi:hypothetical protein